MSQGSINNAKQLNVLSKRLEKGIDVTQKQISECSLEWLQLCSLVEKQNAKIQGDEKNISDSSKAVINQEQVVETSKRDAQDAINSQAIDLNIQLNFQGQESVEEFDSD